MDDAIEEAIAEQVSRLENDSDNTLTLSTIRQYLQQRSYWCLTTCIGAYQSPRRCVLWHCLSRSGCAADRHLQHRNALERTDAQAVQAHSASSSTNRHWSHPGRCARYAVECSARTLVPWP